MSDESAFDKLTRAALAVEKDKDEAIELLGQMYDAWENGCPIYEDPDEPGACLGHALDLTDEQDARIVALLGKTKPYAGPTHADLAARLAALERLVAEKDVELRDEQLKFQQETRRTSELVTMLHKVHGFISTSDGPLGAHSRIAMMDEIEALCLKPINAIDPATAPIEEVRAELGRRGIDIEPAMEKVRAALNAKPGEEGKHG